MSIRNELLEKKKQLEFSIKLAMQKFMEETGLLITEVKACIPPGPVSGNMTEEDIDNKRKKFLLETLEISIRL